MTDEILHTVEFVERNEYTNFHNDDDKNVMDHVYSITARTQIPLPDNGNVVTFGWYEDEESGEKVERVDFDRTGVDYHRTVEYRVVWIDNHYHHQRTESMSGDGLAANEIELNTTVIIEEYER
jgi:hypothetical protein